MLYIKAMKQDGTYQILEADGYVEFLKRDVGDDKSVQQAVEVVYNYYDNDGILRDGRHWLEGDCFIMNDKGFTVSAYHYKPDVNVHTGERSEEELKWMSKIPKIKRSNIMNDGYGLGKDTICLGSEGYGLGKTSEGIGYAKEGWNLKGFSL